MAQYIPKEPLVAEMERLIERAKAERVLYPKTILAAKNYLLIEDYKKLLSILDTLEVKEVDLDGERRKYLTEHFNVYEDGILQSKRSNLPLDTYDVIKIAKHFFELGMQVSNKAQKGEEYGKTTKSS